MKKFLRVLEVLATILGVLSGTEWILNYFDILPGWKVKRYSIKHVEPKVQLFPGQQVRLKPEFMDGLSDGEISDVTWSLSKNGQKFTQDGINPRIILPLVGGNYLLDVGVTLTNGAPKRTGQTSIYLVQEEPQKVEFPEKAKLTVNRSPSTNPEDAPERLQVYAGQGSWVDTKIHEAEDGQIEVVLPNGGKFPVFDGKVIFRDPNKPSDLGSIVSGDLTTVSGAGASAKTRTEKAWKVQGRQK